MLNETQKSKIEDIYLVNISIEKIIDSVGSKDESSLITEIVTELGELSDRYEARLAGIDKNNLLCIWPSSHELRRILKFAASYEDNLVSRFPKFSDNDIRPRYSIIRGSCLVICTYSRRHFVIKELKRIDVVGEVVNKSYLIHHECNELDQNIFISRSAIKEEDITDYNKVLSVEYKTEGSHDEIYTT